LGTCTWREERTDGDGVSEQGAGERRGKNMTVFGNNLLEIRDGRV